jgi:hypothetical protein
MLQQGVYDIIFVWIWRMPLESALTELWLAKGDLAQARPQAERFLAITLATAEHTWQALAWEVNARVAVAELDLTGAQDCVAKELSEMEGFEFRRKATFRQIEFSAFAGWKVKIPVSVYD